MRALNGSFRSDTEPGEAMASLLSRAVCPRQLAIRLMRPIAYKVNYYGVAAAVIVVDAAVTVVDTAIVVVENLLHRRAMIATM